MTNAATANNAPTLSAQQLASRSAIMIAVLLASRLWLLNHPIPVHGDEAGFLAGLGFPAPYPVHHPGYLLWVALGTLTWKLGAAKYTAFVIWSILGSILAPWALYRGLRWIIPDGPAWWTSLAFGLNPLLWFVSVTALTYSCGVALGLFIVGCTWRAITTTDARLIHYASAAMVVCAWLRPDYVLWLGPLLLIGAWRLRSCGGLHGLIVVALSFTAMLAVAMWLYGQGAVERKPVGQFSYWLEVLFQTSAFRLGWYNGLLRSAAKLCGILAWVFGAATFALLASKLFLRNTAQRFPGAISFLLLWVLPLTAFVLLIHMSEPGHIILLVPAGYVFLALSLTGKFTSLTTSRVMSAIAICSALQFLVWPWSVQSTGWMRTVNGKIAYLSAAGLRQIDHRWDIHTPSDIWPTPTHQPTATRPSLAPADGR